MPYNIPNLPSLISQANSNIQSRLRTDNRINLAIRNSVLSALAYNQGAMSSGLYDHQLWIAKQCVPHLADDDIFMLYAAEDGIFRKSASIAKGTVLISATQDVMIPKNTQLQRNDGALYRVIDDTRGNGEFALPIESIEAGLNQNTDKDVVLRFLSPVLYVANTAVVQVLSGGADQESMDSMRSRYIFRCRYPPMGGSRFDYVRWMLECAGVTRAWCFPRVWGGNTVGVAWVYDDREEIFPTSVDIAEVMAYLDSHPDPISGLPVGHSVGAEVVYVNVTNKPLNPVILLIPDDLTIRENVKQALTTVIQQTSVGTTLPRSHLTQVISNSIGEYDHRLVEPSGDVIVLAPFELLSLGDITWQ